MKFKSYAQNFEDYVLWRALKTVEKGFYVDVGAQHPVVDSVSKGFYEFGWQGIHIEPVPAYAELLRKDRPDERVLEMAAGAMPGLLDLNVIPDTGLSTAVDQYAQQHASTLGFQSSHIQVPVDTLENILMPYANREIHWLKIDVEGFEKQVLEGWNSQKNRPWIIVIESVEPMTQNESYAAWEHYLTNAKYEFVYFDGLNRFYLANEKHYLKHSFSSPVNVFDSLTISEESSAQVWLGFKDQKNRLISDFDQRMRQSIYGIESKLEQSEKMLHILERDNINLNQQLVEKIDAFKRQQVVINESDKAFVLLRQQSEAQNALLLQIETQLIAMRQSISWRTTKPLRVMSDLLPTGVRSTLRQSIGLMWRSLTFRHAPNTMLFGKELIKEDKNHAMKIFLISVGRQISGWPVLGRFVRIMIAVIRLPEERIQFKQHMAEHSVRMRNEENARASANEIFVEKLSRHETFIATQIPRLAQKVAELHQPDKHNN